MFRRLNGSGVVELTSRAETAVSNKTRVFKKVVLLSVHEGQGKPVLEQSSSTIAAQNAAQRFPSTVAAGAGGSAIRSWR